MGFELMPTVRARQEFQPGSKLHGLIRCKCLSRVFPCHYGPRATAELACLRQFAFEFLLGRLGTPDADSFLYLFVVSDLMG
jgi:hypothetical protein